MTIFYSFDRDGQMNSARLNCGWTLGDAMTKTTGQESSKTNRNWHTRTGPASVCHSSGTFRGALDYSSVWTALVPVV